jgi:hypothetical protein
MSPPEVWGPVIWSLFHTLSEKISEHSYNKIYPQLFLQFQKICKFLPCPECSRDASIFLEKIKIRNLKTKHDFKNLFYLFHNYVNAKKRKQLFNYANINIYKNYRIMNVINKFFAHYNTKGNMKLLTETFQRQFIINDFKKWFSSNITAFFQPNIPSTINNSQVITQIDETIENPVLEQVVAPVLELDEELVLKSNEDSVIESVLEPDVQEEVELDVVADEGAIEEEDVEANLEPILEPDVETDVEADVVADVEADVVANEEAIEEEDEEADVEAIEEKDEEADVEADVVANEEAIEEEDVVPDEGEVVESHLEQDVETNVEKYVESDDEVIKYYLQVHHSCKQNI